MKTTTITLFICLLFTSNSSNNVEFSPLQDGYDIYLKQVADVTNNLDNRKYIIKPNPLRPKMTALFGDLLDHGNFGEDVELKEKDLDAILSGSIKDDSAIIAAVEDTAYKAPTIMQAVKESYEKAVDGYKTVRANFDKDDPKSDAIMRKAVNSFKQIKRQYDRSLGYVDVLSADDSYHNGYNDAGVRDVITYESALYTGINEPGLETGAFMNGFLFATVNVHNVLVRRAEKTGVIKDDEITFFETTNEPITMTINQAIALKECAVDGRDDDELDKRTAFVVGALTSLHFQQEEKTCYNGVVQEMLDYNSGMPDQASKSNGRDKRNIDMTTNPNQSSYRLDTPQTPKSTAELKEALCDIADEKSPYHTAIRVRDFARGEDRIFEFSNGLINFIGVQTQKGEGINSTPETIDYVLSNAVKDGSVGAAAAYLAVRGTNTDVMAVDDTRSNGIDDEKVQKFVQNQLVEHYYSKTEGIEADAFMDGYLFSTINLDLTIVPQKEATEDYATNLKMAKENLASLKDDEKLKFFGVEMSINEARALMARCTDGVDDADISKKQALAAGVLAGLDYQRQAGVYYDGVLRSEIGALNAPETPSSKNDDFGRPRD